MVARLITAVIAFSAVSIALADEPDPILVLERLRPARDQWLTCVGGQAARLAATKQASVWVADEAVRRCRRSEAEVAAKLRQEIGLARSKRVLDLLRAQDRANLVRAIQARRGE